MIKILRKVANWLEKQKNNFKDWWNKTLSKMLFKK